MPLKPPERTPNGVEPLEQPSWTRSSLEHLKSIAGPEFRDPVNIDHYQSLQEDAYAAYDRVETMVEELAHVLEYEHTRLDKAVKQYGGAPA